jgi:hypothetical protein
MATIVSPSNSSWQQEVDAAPASAARVSIYSADGSALSQAQMGYMATPDGVVTSGLNDSVNAVVQRADRWGNLGVNSVQPVLWEQFESTTLNTQRWVNNAVTFVTATTVTGINLNSTSLTTASAVNVNLSNKRIFRTARSPIVYKCRTRVSNYANSQNDWGLADTVSGAAQIANGAYFQVTTAGTIQCVLTTASTDTTSPLTWVSGSFNVNNFYTWDILVDDDSVTFTVQDTSTGRVVANATIKIPLAAARMFAATHLSAFNRCFCTATPPATAPVHIASFIYLGFLDMQPNKSWSEVLATNSMGGLINPLTIAQLAQNTNSAEPSSATLSNTAAGYTTLGGKFQFAAVAGAATDYVLFGFQVPAGLTLVVRSITIDIWNTVAAVATTPTLFTWHLMANSATVSAASTGIRRFIGAQSLPIGAVAGTSAAQIVKNFQVPIHTDGNRFFGILLRMPVGTATATEVFAGAVDVDCYFE